MTAKAETLLHCPHCGDTATIEYDAGSWYVECENVCNTFFSTKEKAIAAWNRRAPAGETLTIWVVQYRYKGEPWINAHTRQGSFLSLKDAREYEEENRPAWEGRETQTVERTITERVCE